MVGFGAIKWLKLKTGRATAPAIVPPARVEITGTHTDIPAAALMLSEVAMTSAKLSLLIIVPTEQRKKLWDDHSKVKSITFIPYKFLSDFISGDKHVLNIVFPSSLMPDVLLGTPDRDNFSVRGNQLTMVG